VTNLLPCISTTARFVRTACVSLFLLFALESHAVERSQSDPSSILSSLRGSGALGLRAWIEGAVGNEVRVGDPVDLRFTAAVDVYLTTVYVDAAGAVSVLHAGSLDRIRAGETLRFPSSESGQKLLAQPPLGRETVLAIGTVRPLAAELFPGRTSGALLSFASSDEAARFATALVKAVSALSPESVEVSSFSQQVVPASAPPRYATRAIVEQLATKTRALTRPKLDLDVRFAFGSDALTPRAREDLDELGRALEDPRMKKLRFELSGHTDDVGSTVYNLNLSQQRADSARAYLIRNFDISPDGIQARGYGETRPIFDDDSDEARGRNRRVAIEQLR
jgi:outer membrane protein OmpA-like peptidoglycan-associated protein